MERIGSTLSLVDGSLTTRWQAMNLRSVLQPVFSVRHQHPVGCEALVRGRYDDGEAVPPARIFASMPPDRALELGRRCMALHCHNFTHVAAGNSWLFLNLHPAEFIHKAWDDGYFTRLLAETRLAPAQIVFEILETPVAEYGALAKAIAQLRGFGALVAIDNFGAGHSNFERIWRLKPDIVKIDQALLRHAEEDPTLRRSFAGIVEILHQNRCLVAAEGVETEAQAVLALDANVDLVQGHYFSHPYEVGDGPGAAAVDWQRLEQTLKAGDSAGAIAHRRSFTDQIARLHEVAWALASGVDLAAAAAPLFERDDVLRCYAIDSEGRQRSANVPSPRLARIADPRLAPLAAAEAAAWYHRPFFRRAKASPGTVQVSREYLSCADAKLCTTLSIAVDTPGGETILCCDLGAD